MNIPKSDAAFREMVGISFSEATAADLGTFRDYEIGKISEARFLNYFIKRADHTIQALDIINAWNAMLVEIPWQRLQMMKSLMERYRTFILSNTNETHLRWVGQYLKIHYDLNSLDSFVHSAYYSHKMGCRKPDREIYETLLRTEGLNPSETIFFDDNESNISAAKEQGLNVVLVDSEDEIIDLVPRFIEFR